MHYYSKVDLPSLVLGNHKKTFQVLNYGLTYENKTATFILFSTLYIATSSGWYHGYASVNQFTPMFF